MDAPPMPSRQHRVVPQGRVEAGIPMKIMHGCNFHASVNSAVTSFWVSPSHLLCIELARMFMNRAPDSFAMACKVAVPMAYTY